MGMVRIRSSWNADRVAASCIAGKSTAASRPQKRSAGKAKVMNAAELYIQEYGVEAYADWKRREAEIDELVLSGSCNRAQVVKLREENFRRMKSGASHGAVVRMDCGAAAAA